MITLQELCSHLDQMLDSGSFRDYGPNGLQVEGALKISRVATAVSASLATLEAAIAAGFQALIVHHGMFWERDSYCITGSKRKKLKLMLDHGLSLLAYHLPLDAHHELGNNWKAALDLSWSDLEPFGAYQGNFLGVKGKFNPMPVELFKQQLEEYYGHEAHCALGGKELVSRAALVSGGAYKMLPLAVEEGVDCFITGNFDEPAWHQAYEEGVNFFALGHSATEKVGPKALAAHLSLHFGVDASFIDVPNPF